MAVPATARLIVVVAAAALGALFAAGCGLAAVFELQGFGGPRDSDPRPLYIATMALGVVACVLVPLVLWRVLLPDTAPAAKVIVIVVAVLAALGLLGVAAAA